MVSCSSPTAPQKPARAAESSIDQTYSPCEKHTFRVGRRRYSKHPASRNLELVFDSYTSSTKIRIQLQRPRFRNFQMSTRDPPKYYIDSIRVISSSYTYETQSRVLRTSLHSMRRWSGGRLGVGMIHEYLIL
jgi:hypothetical protein